MLHGNSPQCGSCDSAGRTDDALFSASDSGELLCKDSTGEHLVEMNTWHELLQVLVYFLLHLLSMTTQCHGEHFTQRAGDSPLRP